jgi:hypothetical protein
MTMTTDIYVNLQLWGEPSNLNRHARFAKVRAIQQRIKERKEKLDQVNGSCETICQAAHEILKQPTIEKANRTKIDLTHKLQTTRQRIQKREEKLLKVEQEHHQAIQEADRALEQAGKVHQSINCIQQEQEHVEQQMLIIRDDLKIAHERKAFLEHSQIHHLHQAEIFENMLSTSFCNLGLLFQRLEVVFLNLFTVQTRHENNHKQLAVLSQHVELMEIELAARIKTLTSKFSPPTNIAWKIKTIMNDWIISPRILNHPQVKEVIENVIKDNPIINLATELATIPDIESIKQRFKNIEIGIESLTSRLWKNLTGIVAQFGLSLKVIFETPKMLFSWTWTYISCSKNLITWIALGIFTTVFVYKALSIYPLLSLVVGGCIFLFLNKALA